MDEWTLWVREVCSAMPSERTMSKLSNNDDALRILSVYRLPHITSIIIQNPIILAQDWASGYREYAELYRRWHAGLGGQKDAMRWLLMKIEQQPDYLEMQIFPFIDDKFAKELLDYLENEAKAVEEQKKAATGYISQFKKSLSNAVGKTATGSLEKDILVKTKTMPPYLIPLRGEWKAMFQKSAKSAKPIFQTGDMEIEDKIDSPNLLMTEEPINSTPVSEVANVANLDVPSAKEIDLPATEKIEPDKTEERSDDACIIKQGIDCL